MLVTMQTQFSKQTEWQALAINMLVVGLVGLFLLVGGSTGYIFYQTVKQAVASTTLLPSMPYIDVSLGALPITSDETGPIIFPIVRGGETGATGATGALLPNYERKERVNILLLGIDKRPDEEFSRTDTMILVSVDPNGQASMLSIPRDLYIPIPGYDEDRINKAYFFGERDGYPGGGPALAMRTVQYNLGVPVHFYAQIDFDGFRQIINTVDGIDICVPKTIDDPLFPGPNYTYDPFYIEAGCQTLDGDTALKYARTRHIDSDFGRAQRQQEVLVAIRNKALQIGIVPKIPELWNAMSDAFRTDLQLVDIVELSQLTDDIDPSTDVKQAVINASMTVDYVVPDTGAQVLLPLRDKIQVVVDDLFAEVEAPAQPPAEVQIQATQTAVAQAAAQNEEIIQQQQEIRNFLVQENASLVVQNGTNIPGLASQTALFLKESGFNIFQFGPADATTYPHTVIVVYSESKIYTLEVLVALFEVDDANIRRSPNLKSDVDFRVIIGSDFELPDNAQSFAATP